jgi:hypothetical protein
LAPKHDSVGIFAKKNQYGGDIRVGFYLKNLKSEIFQKVLPRFVVLNSIKILWKIVFENLKKWRYNPRWRIFDFLISKIWQKSMNKYFSIL